VAAGEGRRPAAPGRWLLPVMRLTSAGLPRHTPGPARRAPPPMGGVIVNTWS
jgi:hypothetical protein